MTDKPLPLPSDVSRPYWEGLRTRTLQLQRCGDCASYIFYPRSVCPRCLSQRFEWVEASGRGTLYSYTVVR
ncbi:MAG: Zn-ribbon domain-containing OB-fold protein, partial [bacterium]